MNTNRVQRRVIVVGGGFGGVACAKVLRRRLPASEWEIVVFNPENHMIFHPLLAEVVGSSINPDAAAPPLRHLLRGVSCRSEAVSAIDLQARRVEFQQSDGHIGHLDYDHVVLACGRAVNMGIIPGMSDHGFPLKTVGDALALRAHIIDCLERAETCEDLERRRWLTHFVVVGGGFSGVEVAGEINDLVRESRRFYPHVDPQDLRVTIVHATDQILPELNDRLRAYADRAMRGAGIDIQLKASAAAVTRDGVLLTDGRQLSAATVVGTIGTAPALLVEHLDVKKERGALLTEPDLRLLGHDTAWAVGDCARITNLADGKPCPPTGQFAERQGKKVAENIVASVRGTPTSPFGFSPLGQLCAIGRRNAVATVFGRTISGFIAWFAWRTVYLFKLPSWSRRVKVGTDWAWDLVFPRDLVTLKPNLTERVGRAYLRKGDFVFRKGEPALNFYAVERGELEVVRSAAGDSDEVVAVLGPGDFFGEMALLEHRIRSASVRARTDAEVTVLGLEVFATLTNAVAPLKRTIVDAARRRTHVAGSGLPEADAALDGIQLDVLIEAPPTQVRAQAPYREVLQRMASEHLDVVYVVDDERALHGVVTRSDLLRAADTAVHLTKERRPLMTVGDVMSPDPVAVTLHDSARVAAALLWQRGLKSIPVIADAQSRRVVGRLRVETLLQLVIARLAQGGRAGAGENATDALRDAQLDPVAT